MPEPLRFSYAFQFSDGTKKEFDVRLDPDTLSLLAPADAPKPAETPAPARTEAPAAEAAPGGAPNADA